jgi:transposase
MVRKEKQNQTLPDPKWLMPDAMWEAIAPLLPKPKPKGPGTQGGRPCAEPRRLLNAIFFLARTGCQWNALPRGMAPSSTAHDYFQKLVKADVWEQVWREALKTYDELRGLDWKWLSMDGQMSKAPLGVRRLAPTPRTEPKAGPNAAF